MCNPSGLNIQNRGYHFLLSLHKIDKMLTKEKLNRTIMTLPDSFTIDELIDQLIFFGEG
jgi:hypothetical protein